MNEKCCICTKNADEKEIDELYRNLEFVSNAYFSTEQAFPLWETAFALIVGQLIIAYFDGPNIILIIPGILVLIIWFIMVTVSWSYSDYRVKVMKYLQWKLNKERGSRTRFYPESYYEEIYIKSPDMCENIITDWNLKSYFSMGYLINGSAWDSTWWYRRILPLVLAILWLIHVLLIQIGWLKFPQKIAEYSIILRLS